MKRWLVVTALATALVLPAQAAAKTAPYSGTVTPSGTVSFSVITIKKKGKKRKFVKNFRWSAVPVTCAQGPARTTSGSVGFAVKLRGSFNILAENSTGARVEVRGNPSAGTISLSGDLPLDQGGSGQAPCSSGVLNWTAARA